MGNALEGLNTEQLRAVKQLKGPQLILAGAGSGKTRTITHKIAYLVESGTEPKDILAITFTNKAANEMKKRISKLVGPKSEDITAKTFHSFCYQVLRKEHKHVNLKKNFSIYDEKEKTKILKKLTSVDEESLIDCKEVRSLISKAKNEMKSPQILLAEVQNIYDEEVAQIYNSYQEILSNNNAVDFDDLLIKANEALTNKDALDFWQDRFKYIFVDEFQDTNKPQFKLVRALAKKHKNLCVVGDDNQSIYGWRGSDIQYIIDFDDWFPDRKIYNLQTNYRSTPTIIEAASEMIKLNINRTDKRLRAHKKVNGHKIYKFSGLNEYSEAKRVADRILLHLKQYKPEDIAILYRTNSQSKAIEDILRSRYIPYQVLGGVNFYERKEVKDIIAYLRVLANPYDSLSLERIINFPPRKIGHKTLEELKEIAIENNISLWESCLHSENKSIQEFIALMNRAKNLSSIRKITKDIIDSFKIIEYWNKFEVDSGSDKAGNVMEFLKTAEDYDQKAGLEDFLEFLQLLIGDKGESNGVKLMTAHASKGLEFPIVFIVGMGEGLFPLRCQTWTELEEERRLFYVALTRAEDISYVSFPETRTIYGSSKSYTESHLIRSISQKLIKEI